MGALNVDCRSFRRMVSYGTTILKCGLAFSVRAERPAKKTLGRCGLCDDLEQLKRVESKHSVAGRHHGLGTLARPGSKLDSFAPVAITVG